ncbi:Multidrug resistance protein mdtK Multidrug-efflux transporter [Thermobacillus xylanilyticus]|uniref:Multidrug resistance protein mdtK Multidrug-efflux transporter n=1 Tax=Thermobacillus xylanilyticus TaxID=76633 RepID=A0ABM8V765_THEXY|nr:MATE family efflux transporter [Thermobacillus xylanilyticus]CAG5091118.1 Multidrug resistance protein mdtK Multidrug-efflux transporter [Thermobacillus xylanilyticus]
MPTSRSKAAAPSLTEGPIAKTLFVFSLPILLGNVLQTLNGSINSIWVGRLLGETALAATSNANFLMFFLISAIFGISMASVILLGQNLGAQRIQEAKKVVGTSTSFFFILSIITGALGILFSPLILELLNTPEEAMDMAVIYTRIMFAGTPFMFGFNLIMAVMRGAGDSKTPFYFLLLSTVLDIGLNPLLIRGYGPFPEMGIAGSATAALIAQFVSLILLLAYLYGKQYFLRITRDELHLLRMNWRIVKLTIQKGIPMGLNMVIVSLSNLLLIHIVNGYGTEATAAFGIANQISSYVQMPALAIGGAATSMAAQNIGARRWDRVGRITGVGIGFNVLLTGALVLILLLFNRETVSLFLSGDAGAIEIGMHINNLTLWSFIIFGIFNVMAGVVRSAGAVMVPMIISFIALMIIRIPLASVLVNYYGLDAVWWSFPASFAMAALLNALYYKFGGWRKAKLLEQASGASPA